MLASFFSRKKADSACENAENSSETHESTVTGSAHLPESSTTAVAPGQSASSTSSQMTDVAPLDSPVGASEGVLTGDSDAAAAQETPDEASISPAEARLSGPAYAQASSATKSAFSSQNAAMGASSTSPQRGKLSPEDGTTSCTTYPAPEGKNNEASAAASSEQDLSVSHTSPHAEGAAEPAADLPAEQAEPVEEELTPVVRFTRALSQWKDDLRAVITDRTADNLPRYPLSNAHPGGLAQLYALHPTRLSNLVREPGAYKRTLEGARRVISRQAELAAQHGLAPVHLAIGYTSWLEDGVKRTSPALMRPLLFHEDGEDIVLELGTDLYVAPALLAAAARHHIAINETELLEEAGVSSGSFSSTRAFNYLRVVCGDLPDFELRDDLAMGIYDHPAAHLLRELSSPRALAHSEIVRALTGDPELIEHTTRPLPQGSPSDRDPWSERGIGDLSPQHHNIVEAVAAGRSCVIRGQQAVNNDLLAAIISENAAKGRTTVHVSGSRSRLVRVENTLDTAGVGQVVARIDGSPDDTLKLRDCLRMACEGPAPTAHTDADLDAMRTELRQTREALSAYTQQLHAPFGHFGVSAMDALQVLTDITSRESAPRTKVRLRGDVLLEIAKDQGEAARAILHRAADLKMYSKGAVHSAWSGAVINAPEQVEIVMGAIQRLSTSNLPDFRNTVERIASEGQLAPAVSVRDWQAQLDMLQDVREALDVFKPEIFERSAADMVIATAPSQWRKSRGIDMKRSQRSRLMKRAKDLLLPGRHVDDLHRELVLVQERREVWRQFSNADGWPVLPRGLQDAAVLTRKIVADLEVLVPALATGFPDLFDMKLAELQRLLDRLAADPLGAELLPQRVALLKEASQMGLDQLLTDLRRRHVEVENIDAELDLAWWASILGLILASDEAFRGIDPHRLTHLLERCRELDEAQVASLLPQAIDNIQRRRQHAISARQDQYIEVCDFVDHGDMDAAAAYSRIPLVSLLAPAVLTLPTIVPLLVPAGRKVDVLILDDIDALPLAELVPLIARADQVVVFAHGEPEGAATRLIEVLPVAEVAPRPSQLNDHVIQLLAYYGMPHVGIPQPWAMKTEPMRAVWVEASGIPAPGATAIESTAAEVDAVVDVLIDHVLSQPERSVAVIALNAVHATRIREAVARAIAQEPRLRPFFDPAKAEPFVVADPSQVNGIHRDHIVIAVGYAKNAHGRVLHDFGVFSGPEGGRAMAGVLSCAREDITVVSAIRPSEIDRKRVPSMGGQMLVDILATAEGVVPIAPGSWPVIELEPDRLLIDLANRLYETGLEVIPNVGVEGGLRIPLAIGHPLLPDRLLVAVLTDDAEYVAEPSLRVRDRLLPQMLREQGWQVFTAMSLAVFIDPSSVARQIVDVVMAEVERSLEPIEEVQPAEHLTPTVVELAPEEQAALDATNEARARHDEALTGMIQIITAEDRRDSLSSSDQTGGEANTDAHLLDSLAEWNETVGEASAPTAARAPRPPIARGLPLSAYGDDQLDDLALWVRSDGIERSHEELVEELRQALRLTRRGAQTDAVLSNVIRRTEPTSAGATYPEHDEI